MIQISDPKVQAVIDEITAQRNTALDSVALLKGELSESNAALSALAKEIAAQKAEIEALKAQQPAPKPKR